MCFLQINICTVFFTITITTIIVITINTTINININITTNNSCKRITIIINMQLEGVARSCLEKAITS